MKIQFVKPKVQANKRYQGEISKYTLDEEHKVFRVYVTLDKEPLIEFMKRFELDKNRGSAFARFCEEMYVFNEDDGTAELDELEGLRVIVRLKKGRDEKFYVGEIQLDEKYYEEQEGCDEE